MVADTEAVGEKAPPGPAENLLDGVATSDDKLTPDGKLLGKDGEIISAGVGLTTVNIAKAFMGASSFELPWSFSQAGKVGAVVGIVTVAVLSNWTFIYLGELSQICGINRPTYPQIGRVCMGPVGEYLVWFGMAMMTVGVVGSYFLFIGQIFSSLVDSPEFPQWKAVIVVSLLGALMSLFRSLKSLSFTSVTGLCALAVAMCAVIYDALSMETSPPFGQWLAEQPAWNLETYPLFLGGVNYLFLISTAILPIEQEMHPGERKGNGFARAFTNAQLFVTLPNIIFAFISWRAFSYSPEGLHGNILNSLTPGPVTNMVKWFMSLNQLFTVPLFLVPMADAFEHRILAKAEFGTPSGEMKRNACRLLFSLAAATAALLVPDFGLLVRGVTNLEPYAKHLDNCLPIVRSVTVAVTVCAHTVLCSHLLIGADDSLALMIRAAQTGLTGAFGNNLLAFIFVPVLWFERRRALGYWQDVCGMKGYNVPKMREMLKCLLIFVVGVATLLLSGVSTVRALIEKHGANQ